MQHWGPCRRTVAPAVAGKTKPLFLTFDDGPDPASTAAVLAVLKSCGVPATFFVVADRAARHRALLTAIVDQGHGVGNHSFDHKYINFFLGPQRMRRWVDDAEAVIVQLTGKPSVGFRSPAGVRTPLLHYTLNKLQLPLVHWNVRYFDTAGAWTEAHALSSLDKMVAGSIILLHDKQPAPRLDEFLATLTVFIKAAQQRGFEFLALQREFF